MRSFYTCRRADKGFLGFERVLKRVRRSFQGFAREW